MAQQERDGPRFSVGCKVVARAASMRDVALSEIYSGTRVRRAARTRFAIIWALREAGMSYPRIATTVGYEDHTSALHGYREAERLMREDREFERVCRELAAYAADLKPVRSHMLEAA